MFNGRGSSALSVAERIRSDIGADGLNLRRAKLGCIGDRTAAKQTIRHSRARSGALPVSSPIPRWVWPSAWLAVPMLTEVSRRVSVLACRKDAEDALPFGNATYGINLVGAVCEPSGPNCNLGTAIHRPGPLDNLSTESPEPHCFIEGSDLIASDRESPLIALAESLFTSFFELSV